MAMSVDSELVHKLILLITVPVSLFALSLGYKNHSTMNFIVLGIIGLLTLVLAVILGEGVLGENGELFLTMLGSTLVIISHYKNYQICKKTNCDCHE